MSDYFNNIKIEILRDSIKETTDTLRALDNKIIFLVSYNSIFLVAIASMIIRNQDKILIQGSFLSFLFGIFIFLWMCLLINVMLSIMPFRNPLNPLYSNAKDKFENIYFISIDEHEKLSSNYLANNFDKIVETELDLKEMLYTEILKLSYIRNKKISSIKLALGLSTFFTLSFGLIFLYYFYINTLIQFFNS